MKRLNKIENILFVNCQYLGSNPKRHKVQNDRPNTPDRLYRAEIFQMGGIDGQRTEAVAVRWPHMEGDPAKPTKDGFIYEIAAGNGRLYSFSELGRMGVVDPTTVERDPATGNVIPGSGKPFSTLRCVVYTDCTAEDVLKLKNDNTGEKLTKLDVVRSLMEAVRDFNLSEKAALQEKYALMLQVFPIDNPTQLVKYTKYVESFPKEWSEARRQEAIKEYHIGGPSRDGRLHGTYLVINHAYNSATVVREAYEAILQGKQTWPDNKEIHNLYSLYNQDVQEDATGKINPDNPGPKFLEKWNEILAAVEVAKAEGTRKKSTAMLSADQIDKAIGKYKCRIIKLALMFVKNNVPGRIMELVDAEQQKLEAGKVTGVEYASFLDDVYKQLAKENAKPAEPEVKADAAA